MPDPAIHDYPLEGPPAEPFENLDETGFRARIQLYIVQLQSALQAERERGTGFLLLPVSAGTGVITYFTQAQETSWLSLILPLCLLVAMRWWVRERYYWSSILLLAIFFQIGMFCGKLETWRYSTAMVGSDVTTRLTGRVVGLEAQYTGGWRLTIDVLSTERPVLRHAPERLRMTARDIPAQTEIGSTLTGLVRLRPHSGPVRPGNYDFAFNGYFKGNGGNGFYMGTPVLAKTASLSWVGDTFSYAIATLRHIVGTRVTSVVSGEDGAIAAALISGQRDGISEHTNETLRNSGLAHVLSISGLHLALAAGVVIIGFRSVAGLFPSFAARHPIKKYAAAAALFSSAFYLALSGSDVAAQRSFVMIMVMLVALLFDRAALSIRNLAIAALIAFISSPHEVLGPSFQMSFSATAGLVAAFAWWSDRKSALHNQGKIAKRQKNSKLKKWFVPIVATAATSIVAGIASGIYSAYHFNNTAPFGLLGNILAMPVISIIIMPFAVLSLLLMPLQLDWLPLQIMGLGVWGMRQIAELVSSIAPAGNPGIISSGAIISWTIAVVIAVICTTRLRNLSLLLVAIGFFFYFVENDPDIMISEDAKLVAVGLADGRLAVNRSRPSRFTIQNWAKAYDVSEIVPPVIAGSKKNGTYQENAFYCEENICSITLADGRMLSYTETLGTVETACHIGDVVILAVAGKKPECMAADKLVITRRELALKGALEIRLGDPVIQEVNAKNNVSAGMGLHPVFEDENDADTFESELDEPEPYDAITNVAATDLQSQQSVSKNLENDNKLLKYNDKLTYSVGDPQRPWHLYRLYSRAGRGLADYVAPKAKANQKNSPINDDN
ncbi:ComEC/Rec2 family competence protein [Paenochrobactrum sp. BZR 588]|uniref:ComEC/Rec2 family competence protein n=1 Tax=unclassified Paenochrobactrum TaxID=2639760 RepID=UPI0038550503